MRSLLIPLCLSLLGACLPGPAAEGAPRAPAADVASCAGGHCLPVARSEAFRAEGPGEFFGKLFDTSDFPPRWYCGRWSSTTGWLHIVSDVLIFAAYFAIPVVLLFFLRRRRDLPFPKIIWLFAAFILACGLVHLVEAGIFWWPVYRLSGLLKATTAVVSCLTVLVLIRILPGALKLPSLAMMAKELESSRDRLALAMESGQIGAWARNLQTDEVTCDRRTCEIFDLNFHAAPFHRDSVLDRIHPEDRERVEARIRECLERGTFYEAIYRVIHRDGTIHQVHCHGKLVRGDDGQPDCLTGVCQDITAQKDHEHAVREGAAKMEAVLNTAADAIITIDEEGRIQSVNPATERIFGYEQEEMLGECVGMFMPLPANEDHDCPLARFLATKEPDSFGRSQELPGQRKNGAVFPMELSISEISLSDQPLFTVIIRDISIRKAAELALRESQEQLTSLIKNMPAVAYRCACDQDWTMAFISDAIEDLAGYPAAEFINNEVRSFASVIHPEDNAAVREEVFSSVEAGEPFDLRYRLVDREGRIRHVAERGRALYGPEGEVLCLDGIIKDMTNEVQAQEAVRESENFAHRILDSLYCFAGVCSLDGTLIEMNQASLSIARLEEADVVGHPFAEAYWWSHDAREQARLREAIGKAVAGEPSRYDAAMRIAYGQLITVDFQIVPMFNERGEVTHLVPSAIDVTDRIRTHEALAESEERFRTAFEQAAVGIAHIAPDGSWLRVNERLCAILGYSREEMLETNIQDVTHPDDLGADREYTESMLAGEIDSYSMEKRYQRKDGSHVWVNLTASLVRHPGGEPKYFIAVIEDIQRRKEAERAMWLYHAEAKKLSLVASKTQHSVVISDAQGRIEWVNEAFTKLTGYTLEDVRGKKPGEILQGENTDPLTIKEVANKLRERQSVDTEIINYSRSGREYWIEMKIDPVFDDEGELSNFIATQVEITERKRAEEALRAAKEAAEQASQAKSEFLASMSHELRTPLNGVIGMTELLADSNLDERQQRFVAACQSSGRSLLTLINDILDFSKLEAGRLDLDEHPFELLQLLDDVMETMPARLEGKDVELVYALEHPSNFRLLGDSHRLQQVLVNLLGNAIKFTEKGKVSLLAEPLEITPATARFRFSVKDTGIGIPADRLNRLFQEFSQVDSSTSRKYGGTGLGLSICKNIVEIMGGEIGVESTVGVGSEFWFVLAFARLPAKRSSELTAPHDLSALRVLIADGSEVCRQFYQKVVQAWGMEVATAATAEEALRLLSETPDDRRYDLALVAQDVPGGCEHLAGQIRENPALSDLILFLTVPAEDRRKVRGKEFSHCLQKPIGQSHLLDAIVNTFCCAGRSAKGDVPGSEDDAAGEEGTKARRVRVLLAEDNETNQMFTKEILARKGWECDLVCNGIEALEAVESQEYDLVLMDCQMPEMDGFTAARNIRIQEAEGKRSGRLPIIALTANVIKGDRERCLEAGMDDYVSKPFKPVELTDAIQHALSPGNESQPDEKDAAGTEETSPTKGLPIDEGELLERCMQDAAFIETLLKTFEKDSLLRLDDIVQHAEEGDAAAAGESAHALKGMAGILAARPLHAAAFGVEQAGKADDLAHVQSLLEGLQREVQGCLEYLPTLRKHLEQRGEAGG